MQEMRLAKGWGTKLPIKHYRPLVVPDPAEAARPWAKELRLGMRLGAAKAAQPIIKQSDNKSKSDVLVCPYCGGDDLTPSFI